jgi:murein DD-endopeptidase MepM/ murein hydrolase activator NlpD
MSPRFEAYMRAGGHTVMEIVHSKDLNEVSQREAYVRQVVANDRDILEELRSAQEDQAAE